MPQCLIDINLFGTRTSQRHSRESCAKSNTAGCPNYHSLDRGPTGPTVTNKMPHFPVHLAPPCATTFLDSRDQTHCLWRWAKVRVLGMLPIFGTSSVGILTQKKVLPPTSTYFSDQNEEQNDWKEKPQGKSPVTLLGYRALGGGHLSSGWASISLTRLCTTPHPPRLLALAHVLQRLADAVGNDALRTRRDIRTSKSENF